MKDLATCKPIWLSCTSHHISVHEAYGPVCLQLQYSWTSKKPLKVHGTLTCYINYSNFIFCRV